VREDQYFELLDCFEHMVDVDKMDTGTDDPPTSKKASDLDPVKIKKQIEAAESLIKKVILTDYSASSTGIGWIWCMRSFGLFTPRSARCRQVYGILPPCG
jgi:hypothetical protein